MKTETEYQSKLGKQPAIETFRLEAYDGWLCIAYTCSMFDYPKLLTTYWPTDIRSAAFIRDYGNRIGESVLSEGLSVYILKAKETFGMSARITLKNGANTKPVYTLELNYDCPKTRKGIETEYRNGRWYKLLKTGWTEA